MTKDQILEKVVSDEFDAEMKRLKDSVFGQCYVCDDDVTEWDLTYGPYGGEWCGDRVYHVVCKSGKIAVAV